MGCIRVNKISYWGRDYFFESPIFEDNLILIEGDNGTGKTTLCNLIYFALGGRVREFIRSEKQKKHKEITNDQENFVELYLTISGEYFQLIRYIDDNDISITPSVPVFDENDEIVNFTTEKFIGETQIFPVNRNDAEQTIFSDWILGKLKISVVDIYQGYTSYKINISHLFRLIYHDQQPDPEGIYKKLDTKSNYIADSELLRNAIFQLLIGKSFSEYYKSVVDSKLLEKDKSVAKSLLDEYLNLASELKGTREDRNLTFLKDDLHEKERQLDKLHISRQAFKNNRFDSSSVDSQIQDIKSNIVYSHLKLSEEKELLMSLFEEKYKLVSIKDITAQEVAQINKIIHSHDRLNLFSSDTCPYCLENVEREIGHCVCGSQIDEQQYERFFYTSKEYKDILKAKIKTLATIKIAIESCDEEIEAIMASISQSEKELPGLKKNLQEKIGRIDERIDLDTINDIDDKILEVREEIGNLQQLIEIESKLEKIQSTYNQARDRYQDAELKRKSLEAQTKVDINSKVKKFSKKYNQLVTETLPNCHSARISVENYHPIIDDGDYKEASSGVSIRLMYYLTLMDMSLDEVDIPFPKFLLIDTPETSGIELDNLKKCLGKIDELNQYEIDFQVILTTGLSKYPRSFLKKRVIYMPDKQHRLLKKREQ